MGLAAFNRMRRLEAEQKEKEGVKNDNDSRKGKKRPTDKRDK